MIKGKLVDACFSAYAFHIPDDFVSETREIASLEIRPFAKDLVEHHFDIMAYVPVNMDVDTSVPRQQALHQLPGKLDRRTTESLDPEDDRGHVRGYRGGENLD